MILGSNLNVYAVLISQITHHSLILGSNLNVYAVSVTHHSLIFGSNLNVCASLTFEGNLNVYAAQKTVFVISVTHQFDIWE